MENNKYPIPDEILTATIEALRDYTRRLETDAVSLAGLNSPKSEKLARERLEDAEVAGKLFNYYLNL